MLQALLGPLVVASGVVKAGAVIWVGLHVGAPAWAIAPTAALWVTGPAFAAWLWQRRQKLRAAAAEAAPVA